MDTEFFNSRLTPIHCSRDNTEHRLDGRERYPQRVSLKHSKFVTLTLNPYRKSACRRKNCLWFTYNIKYTYLWNNTTYKSHPYLVFYLILQVYRYQFKKNEMHGMWQSLHIPCNCWTIPYFVMSFNTGC